MTPSTGSITVKLVPYVRLTVYDIIPFVVKLSTNIQLQAKASGLSASCPSGQGLQMKYGEMEVRGGYEDIVIDVIVSDYTLATGKLFRCDTCGVAIVCSHLCSHVRTGGTYGGTPPPARPVTSVKRQL